VTDRQAGRTGRLEGADLAKARDLRSSADRDIHELGAIIGRSLGYEMDGARLGAGLIKFDNDKVIVLQGNRCWVSEDPPGLSRDCTEAERIGMMQCLAPMGPDVILKA